LRRRPFRIRSLVSVSRLPTRLPVYLVSGWDRRVEADVCICGDQYRGNAVEHDEAASGEIKAVGYGCDVSNEARVEEVFASIKGKGWEDQLSSYC
jgi:hypothetical protein